MMAARSGLTALLAIAALSMLPDAARAERLPEPTANRAGAIEAVEAAADTAATKTAPLRVAAAEGEVQDSAPAVEPASGAPYMRPLARLSSILGSVHFLRRLCGDGGAEVWRDKMNELLETLSPNAADRQILVAAFNDGFRAFESTYRNCTPAARVALARYQGEGASLSREISARYGN